MSEIKNDIKILENKIAKLINEFDKKYEPLVFNFKTKYVKCAISSKDYEYIIQAKIEF